MISLFCEKKKDNEQVIFFELGVNSTIDGFGVITISKYKRHFKQMKWRCFLCCY